MPSSGLNPLVPDAHYSERQDKPLSLQIQQLEIGLKLNCEFLFFAPWALIGEFVKETADFDTHYCEL